MATLAPRSANACARPAPRPREPPVMRTVLPERSLFMVVTFVGWDGRGMRSLGSSGTGRPGHALMLGEGLRPPAGQRAVDAGGAGGGPGTRLGQGILRLQQGAFGIEHVEQIRG